MDQKSAGETHKVPGYLPKAAGHFSFLHLWNPACVPSFVSTSFSSFLFSWRFLKLLLLLSHFSHVRLLATPWTAAQQAPRPWDFQARALEWDAIALLTCDKWCILINSPVIHNQTKAECSLGPELCCSSPPSLLAATPKCTGLSSSTKDYWTLHNWNHTVSTILCLVSLFLIGVQLIYNAV